MLNMHRIIAAYSNQHNNFIELNERKIRIFRNGGLNTLEFSDINDKMNIIQAWFSAFIITLEHFGYRVRITSLEHRDGFNIDEISSDDKLNEILDMYVSAVNGKETAHHQITVLSDEVITDVKSNGALKFFLHRRLENNAIIVAIDFVLDCFGKKMEYSNFKWNVVNIDPTTF